jgi:hypothetical protein
MIDLQDLPEAEREVEAQWPFNLAQGPLFRATLLCLGAEEYLLLMAMHHIVCDKRSTGVLFRELATLDEAFSTGQLSSLPELPIQYADFAAWQREVLQGDILDRHFAYWKQHLAGSPAGLDFPTDRPRLPVPTSGGSKYCVMLPKALTDALEELSRQEGWTLSQIEVGTGTSKFDLTLELDDRPEGLIGRFVYSTDLFDQATIALLAILKAGGAYVPLDPTYPQERLEYMVQDAQMSIVLTQKRLLDLLPQDETKLICLDTDDAETLLGSSAAR